MDLDYTKEDPDMAAAITITAEGKDWPISLREISQWRTWAEVMGTRFVAALMANYGFPIEIALAILTRRPRT